MAQESNSKQQIKVRYNETTAQYASQFILNSSEQEIIINFSSGPLNDPNSGETMLPIHTRIAVSSEGAKRLHAILGQVLAQQNDQRKISEAAQAQLPKMQQ